MANGPIQVVLNSDQYLDDVKPKKGGSRKDFYEGKDSLFVKHKNELLNQLTRMSSLSSVKGKISYAKVKLIKEALAKSHRPIMQIFTEDNECQVVGGRRFGEMIVELGPSAVDKIIRKIEYGAEETVIPRKNRKGDTVTTASVCRCEVGVIDTIQEYGSNDKLDLDIDKFADMMTLFGNGMYVEFFDIPSSRQYWDIVAPERLKLYNDLIKSLQSIPGILLRKSNISALGKLMHIQITDHHIPVVNFNSSEIGYDNKKRNATKDKAKYLHALNIISNNALVKSISLVPMIGVAPPIKTSDVKDRQYSIPVPNNLDKYPIVGVVDSGISHLFDNWIVERWEPVLPGRRDNNHATFISGLLVNGNDYNEKITEKNGCRLVDFCLMPKDSEFSTQYPNGLDDVISELRAGLSVLVHSTSVRIINLSLNVYTFRTPDMYSHFAVELDKIAEELNIIFVISAGNLGVINGIQCRNKWSTDSQANVNELILRKDDTIYSPAESLRNISVAALNISDEGLASYSCRGKGTNIAIKPDVVCFGGDNSQFDTGMVSLNTQGEIVSGCGTSFAAPLVAKTLATIDNMIDGNVSRETLLALLIHSCYVPSTFKAKEYQSILKDVIGYGLPKDASQILNGDSHSISLVFANRIMPKKHLEFHFSWPKCLIRNGKCYGNIKITLVSTPQINWNYKDEMIRENISVSFGQIMPDNSHKNQVTPLYKTQVKKETDHLYEWQLIEENMKWSPIKVYERNIHTGISGPTNWYLDVNYLSRESVMPLNTGLPFTIIMTISDPEGTAPVYDEMRFIVSSTGAQISDIQTAARITQRI